jgi:hypothetical protein
MRARGLMAFIAAVGVATACESSTGDDDDLVTYTATLNGAQEVPAVTTAGSGTFSGTYDPDTEILTYTVNYAGLGSAATMGHIHGPAAAGAGAGILVDLISTVGGRTMTLGTSGSGAGTVNLTITAVITPTVSGDSLRKLLDSGNAYVNIHTGTNGNGEIRGQITRQ